MQFYNSTTERAQFGIGKCHKNNDKFVQTFDLCRPKYTATEKKTIAKTQPPQTPK